MPAQYWFGALCAHKEHVHASRDGTSQSTSDWLSVDQAITAVPHRDLVTNEHLIPGCNWVQQMTAQLVDSSTIRQCRTPVCTSGLMLAFIQTCLVWKQISKLRQPSDGSWRRALR